MSIMLDHHQRMEPLAIYFQADADSEVERLHGVVTCLAQHVRDALEMIAHPSSQVPAEWIDAQRQIIADADYLTSRCEHARWHTTDMRELLVEDTGTDEIERLHGVIDSLTDDLRIALGIITKRKGQAPRIWLRVLEQDMALVDRQLAQHKQHSLPSLTGE